ncbi:hypothetical protein D918_07556 [Trichuris suis]|nr:hypothetical protein D918_07556 [Trichuris suis]
MESAQQQSRILREKERQSWIIQKNGHKMAVLEPQDDEDAQTRGSRGSLVSVVRPKARRRDSYDWTTAVRKGAGVQLETGR